MGTRAIDFAASFSPYSCFKHISIPGISRPMVIVKMVNSHRTVVCSAIQETATSAVATDAKEIIPVETEAAAKPKPKPKAAEVTTAPADGG